MKQTSFLKTEKSAYGGELLKTRAGRSGASRWAPLKRETKDRFWDYRPYSRVVRSFRAFLNLRDYIRINMLEGIGYRRKDAHWLIARRPES